MTRSIDEIIAENARLKNLEQSVFRMAESIRNREWDVSAETGAAGEIHAAITSLYLDLESEAEARMSLEEKMAQAGPRF
ncbi:hypothetical protein [Pseudomonas sp. NBRC 111132]|uniref:hypothetical protein n=1 Tax=Pseudomonas sp. NBRC 111132 TaxID=1661047 RepID=UPI000761DE0C|nr:hypothetical protein [Pseudomonas sp. NBRC 111132]